MHYHNSPMTDFESRALDTFRFQAENCPPYRQYIELMGIDPNSITSFDQIPYLPIEIFRTHRVYTGDKEPELIFNSSGTTGGETSTHYVKSAALYEESLLRCFTEFYGSPSQYELRTMLPSYREGSSLLYMIEKLRPLCTGSKILLIGVTFALLEASESGEAYRADIVMETGGMKGRDYQISREDLHEKLCRGFGVEKIHSEYGMCELLSQAYSSGDGVFRTPSSMRVSVRDLRNPMRTGIVGQRGGINVCDLSNRYSCSFVATGDSGILHEDGSFEVLGRIEGEILRGCNML